MYMSMYLHRWGVAVSSHGYRHRKLLHEDRQRPQFARKDEIEQRPQLFQIVLHRWAWQDEPVRSAKLEGREQDREKQTQTTKRQRDENKFPAPVCRRW